LGPPYHCRKIPRRVKSLVQLYNPAPASRPAGAACHHRTGDYAKIAALAQLTVYLDAALHYQTLFILFASQCYLPTNYIHLFADQRI
jgi:hypothetical protein